MRPALPPASAGYPRATLAPAGDRNGYLDLVRVLAICGVLTGHWLLSSITYTRGQLSGESAMPYVSWSGWATLAFQVVPAFFLIGGYVSALSWPRHHDAGANWTGWTRRRAVRLLGPTAVFVVAGTAAAVIALIAGVNRAEVSTVGWSIAYQLWFLPVYLLLNALTPVLLTAHQRWGLRVPAVMAAAAAVVDIAVVGGHVPVLGYVNYFLVWGAIYQLGFAWQDGTLTRSRLRPLALVAAGAAALAALLAWSPFPVDMIGAGHQPGNTDPPSVALLAFATAQAGLAIAAEPLGSRLLRRPGQRRVIERLSDACLPAYLWHLVPVALVAVALYPAGLLPAAVPGTAAWWESRPAWIAALTVTLITLVALVTRLQRLLRVPPAELGTAATWSPATLAAGLVATGYALTRLAITGFAPGGTPPGLTLAAFAAGLAFILLTGTGRSRLSPSGPAADAGAGLGLDAGQN